MENSINVIACSLQYNICDDSMTHLLVISFIFLPFYMSSDFFHWMSDILNFTLLSAGYFWIPNSLTFIFIIVLH